MTGTGTGTGAEVLDARASGLFDVTGQSYVVTGAASGLGTAIAQVLVANGAQVLLVDRDADGLAKAVRELGDLEGRATSAIADVTDADSLRRAIDSFIQRTGRIDGMFANAGISGGPGFGTTAGAVSGQVEQQNASHWRSVLDVNLLGVLSSLQAVVPQMKRQGSGSIVITASISGLQVEPFVSYAYAAAKAAAIQLTRQSALELAPHGIRVNAMAPGFIKTAIGGGRLHDAQVVTDLSRKIPLGRLGLPRDIQGIALLLASAAGSYITGCVIPIDGGALLGAAASDNTSTDEST
jgi:NAD(P)-dependent dehydrogenase (short-subunit alcohol dehydrogenase family)